VQGDNLAIVLFLFSTGATALGTGISLAVSALRQGGRTHRALMFGSFAVAALLVAAGIAWPFLRDLSSGITTVVKQVATSPVSGFVLIIAGLGLIVSLSLRRDERRASSPFAGHGQQLSRIWLLLPAAILAGGFALVVISSLSSTKPDTLTPPHTFGPHNTLRILDDLQRARELGVPGGWNVLLTGPSESTAAQAALSIIMTKGIKEIHFLDPPNRNVDLDAPPIPDPQFSGIILHGNNALNRALLAFQGCLQLKTTQSTNEAFDKHYRVPNFVWIEFGRGSPWSDPQACSG
jgi:hypothetical protein